MLEHISSEKIIFIDIETVPSHATYHMLSDHMQALWDKKAKTSALWSQATEEPVITEEAFKTQAGLYAEFGKIICISVGIINSNHGYKVLRVKSFAGHDENELLSNFADMLHALKFNPGHLLCGHNIKEFDLPFIGRRMLINGVTLPSLIDVAGKKPWEIQCIDTMELWKFGSYRHNVSLALLTALFEIPSPKDDIDGSQVAEVYYQTRDLDRIVKYCEKDVLATTQIFLKMKNEELIKNENIVNV